MRLRVAPLTLGVLLTLAGLNAWLLAIAVESPVLEPEASAPVALAAPPAFEIALPRPKPITAYAHTLAKPLLFKTRAPYVPPPPAPPPAPKPVATSPQAPVDPGLALGGVVIVDGARKAYIFNKADARGTWLSEGESILGWKVVSIDALAARLQQAGRSLDLELYPRKK
jgi:hypothetical protein